MLLVRQRRRHDATFCLATFETCASTKEYRASRLNKIVYFWLGAAAVGEYETYIYKGSEIRIHLPLSRYSTFMFLFNLYRYIPNLHIYEFFEQHNHVVASKYILWWVCGWVGTVTGTYKVCPFLQKTIFPHYKTHI